jgi:predicted  nucleic acid-binding Zn-ribbon protein
LALQRRERQKEMEQITNAEDRAASELEDIQEEAKMRQGSLDETSRRAKESDLEKFNSENGKLGKEREKLMGELAELRARNKEMETQARKKKSKGEQEVEAWLNDYDRDMGSKESAYRDELAVYERVVAQLEVRPMFS